MKKMIWNIFFYTWLLLGVLPLLAFFVIGYIGYLTGWYRVEDGMQMP